MHPFSSKAGFRAQNFGRIDRSPAVSLGFRRDFEESGGTPAAKCELNYKAAVRGGFAPGLSRAIGGGTLLGQSHETEAVRAAVRGAGAHLLFLPPCSPDLNPIEQVFAKLKHWLRDAQPRCRETLWRSVGDTLDKFKPRECANYLVNAGYTST